MVNVLKDRAVALVLIVSAGVVSSLRLQGAMDASQILKPALARGELRYVMPTFEGRHAVDCVLSAHVMLRLFVRSCIGATTLDEYRKYIEKAAALARRFQVQTLIP